MTQRVCLIVGDNHTEHCGVKDYSLRLAEALREFNIDVEVAAPKDWGMKSFLAFCSDLRKRKFDVVHLQYPSIGNRKSLCPHSLGKMRVAEAFIVTLHEYSFLPFAQRASTQVFRWTGQEVIFTTSREAALYGSRRPRRVIPIGSNVPACPLQLERVPTVLYFGQIRPNKGLEDFLELARIGLNLKKPFAFKIIGSISERRTEYYKALRDRSPAEVTWLIDLSFEEVARQMASSLAAYLPFPDGASYRKGSLLAALTNGLPVVTTLASTTPAEMVPVLLTAPTPAQALVQIESLHSSPHRARELGNAARSFAENFSWTEIASKHKQAYDAVLAVKGFERSLREPERSAGYSTTFL